MNNKMLIGLFAMNQASGYTVTKSSKRWNPSWENNVLLAKKADKLGIDFLLSIARWRGFGGETNPHGSNLEPFTWAAGLLGATKNINIFSTIHLPLINPVYASKIMVTANHIGNGRFGLNAVCGWNEFEFNMHGVEFNDHNKRYKHGSEWMEIVSKIWTDDEPFDFSGEFFNLEKVSLNPKPINNTKPMVMNAGRSEQGQEFAINYADYIFLGHRNLSSEAVSKDINELQNRAIKFGRENLDICTNIFIVCKPTQKEAEEFYNDFAIKNADDDAINNIMVERGIDKLPTEFQDAFRARAGAGHGAPNIVGDPDFVASELIRLHKLGIRGFALGLFNYIDDLDFLSKTVLTDLQEKGFRS
ncbi:MAG: LLM class flavin-dependent oxidoreductase [Dehalococcoidia bacterium]